MFSVPNEAARSPKHGARMKAQGLRSGVPDICLALPVGGMPGMYIEMKRGSGGKVSENQQKWIDRLRSVGYVVEVCYGAEEAKEAINNYLNSAS